MSEPESKNTVELYFYSGTGNSLWVARNLAGMLSAPEPVSMNTLKGREIVCASTTIGFVFPVHIWGIPFPVMDFLRRCQIRPSSYIFAVAVNAGQVAETLVQLKQLLEDRQLSLSSGFSIDMPSNYIPWGGASSIAKQQRKFAAALNRCSTIADVVLDRTVRPPEKGMYVQNKIFSFIYRKSLESVVKMDKSFFADLKCTVCRICERVCPAQNISIQDGKPVWGHKCEQCFACIQWCPQESIQYGKGTAKKKRYHHPDISIQDILAANKARP